jgi:hypothetical protein
MSTWECGDTASLCRNNPAKPRGACWTPSHPKSFGGIYNTSLKRHLKLIVKARMQELDADGFDSLQPHMFDDAATTLTKEIEDLWEKVHNIYLEAERCHNHHKDESAWVELVRNMLKISGIGRVEDMLEINSV